MQRKFSASCHRQSWDIRALPESHCSPAVKVGARSSVSCQRNVVPWGLESENGSLPPLLSLEFFRRPIAMNVGVGGRTSSCIRGSGTAPIDPSNSPFWQVSPKVGRHSNERLEVSTSSGPSFTTAEDVGSVHACFTCLSAVCH